MAKFNMDFTDAKEFTVCSKGEHDFKITKSDIASYVKDGEQRLKLELTCEVFGGEDSGNKVFHSIFLKNPTGLFMFMNRIGIKVEKKAYSDMDTNMFIGKTFTAVVEHETYTRGDGSIGNKAVIVESTIRKYVSTNDTPDVFEDFGNTVSIDDNFLS